MAKMVLAWAADQPVAAIGADATYRTLFEPFQSRRRRRRPVHGLA
jgi:hypothetical protein